MPRSVDTPKGTEVAEAGLNKRLLKPDDCTAGPPPSQLEKWRWA